jgi:hypothetical protein
MIVFAKLGAFRVRQASRQARKDAKKRKVKGATR